MNWTRATAVAAAALLSVVVIDPPTSGADVVISGPEGSTIVSAGPCRLVDTRPGPSQAGPRSTPLESGETLVIDIATDPGDCALPLETRGLMMNVTAVRGTDTSFLTVFPGDAPDVPVVSSLNWTAGHSPVSNAVTAELGAGHELGLYNDRGTVDLVIDVVAVIVATTDSREFRMLEDQHAVLQAQADAIAAAMPLVFSDGFDFRRLTSRLPEVVAQVDFVPPRDGVLTMTYSVNAADGLAEFHSCGLTLDATLDTGHVQQGAGSINNLAGTRSVTVRAQQPVTASLICHEIVSNTAGLNLSSGQLVATYLPETAGLVSSDS